MNPIQQALQSVGGDISKLFSSGQKILSPLPKIDSPGGINDPTQSGLNYFYQQQALADQLAKQNPASPAPSQPQADSPIQQALNMLNPKGQQAQAQTLPIPKDATSYEKSAAKVFQKQGVPPAVGLGIWAMEGRGKTINPNNPYNIGAYDTNPQNANAYDFKDPLDGTNEAAKFLAGQSQYMDSNKKKIFQQALTQYKKTGDQEAYLKTIAPTYSSNPAYAQTVIQTPEFQRWSYNN